MRFPRPGKLTTKLIASALPCAVALLSLTAARAAEAPTPLAPEFGLREPMAGETASVMLAPPPEFGLTGGWGGLRTAAKEVGLTFDLSHTLDWSVPAQGALAPRGALRGLLDARTMFAPPALDGGKFTVEYLAFFGHNAAPDIGALVNYSNIDAPRFDHWAELSYEQTLFDGGLRLRLGQLDANTEFDHTGPGAEFLNSAAAYDPAIFTFRTYPNPALGANVFAQVGCVSAGLGVYGGTIRQDADFNRPFVIGEVGVTGDTLGRVAVGCWRDNARFTRFDATTQSGTGGFYALAERQIWKANPAAKDDARGASIFAQFGSASGAISSIRQHFGLGVSATGLLSGHDTDTCGAYVSVCVLSRDDPALTAAHETAVEAFYGVELTAFSKLKADVQLIRHPGGDITRQDALVATLRLVTTF